MEDVPASASPIDQISAEASFTLLSRDAAAVLIDVRTHAEWSYVGVPDLEDIGKAPVLQEWQTYPDQTTVTDFGATLARRLEAQGVGRDDPLLFLCRSGVRSLSAAQAMREIGYTRCLNVEHGFEGPPDADRHRGGVGGWKADGLPWRQT